MIGEHLGREPEQFVQGFQGRGDGEHQRERHGHGDDEQHGVDSQVAPEGTVGFAALGLEQRDDGVEAIGDQAHNGREPRHQEDGGPGVDAGHFFVDDRVGAAQNYLRIPSQHEKQGAGGSAVIHVGVFDGVQHVVAVYQNARQQRQDNQGDDDEFLFIQLRLFFLDLAAELSQVVQPLRPALGFGLLNARDFLLFLAHVPTLLSPDWINLLHRIMIRNSTVAMAEA